MRDVPGQTTFEGKVAPEVPHKPRLQSVPGPIPKKHRVFNLRRGAPPSKPDEFIETLPESPIWHGLPVTDLCESDALTNLLVTKGYGTLGDLAGSDLLELPSADRLAVQLKLSSIAERHRVDAARPKTTLLD